jgi:hypothetical protein
VHQFLTRASPIAALLGVSIPDVRYIGISRNLHVSEGVRSPPPARPSYLSALLCRQALVAGLRGASERCRGQAIARHGARRRLLSATRRPAPQRRAEQTSRQSRSSEATVSRLNRQSVGWLAVAAMLAPDGQHGHRRGVCDRLHSGSISPHQTARPRRRTRRSDLDKLRGCQPIT